MSDQFAFTDLIEEMEAAEHAKVDAHRDKVHAWFDALSMHQKQELSSMFAISEWLTCQALSAAAGDHHSSLRMMAGSERGM
jgi:hypothetical protein